MSLKRVKMMKHDLYDKFQKTFEKVNTNDHVMVCIDFVKFNSSNINKRSFVSTY